MNHATIDNLDEIMDVFKQYKDVFPHIRSDKIQRMIESENLVWEEKVLITYNHYQRRQRVGTYEAQKGDCILHQIAAKNHNGSASQALQNFFDFVKPRRVFLSVRSDNEIAKKFYLKNNMKLVGATSWARGTLPGDVYLYEN